MINEIFVESGKYELKLANRCYRQKIIARRRRKLSLNFLIWFRRAYGRDLDLNTRHLEKKRRKCYPRGKAFERLIELEIK